MEAEYVIKDIFTLTMPKEYEIIIEKYIQRKDWLKIKKLVFFVNINANKLFFSSVLKNMLKPSSQTN